MSGLSNHLEKISDYKLLSESETASLFSEYKNGSHVAKQKLTNHNLRMVVKVAYKYENRDEEKILEYIQEGTLGLIRAIELFDVEKGFLFSTFAYRWIYSKIGELFSSGIQASHVPIHIKRIARKIDSIEKELSKSMHPSAIAADAFKEYNLSADKPLTMDEFSRIRALNSGAISMNFSTNDDSLSFQDLVLSSDNTENNAVFTDLNDWVTLKLSQLPENQRKAIGSYFGIQRRTDRKYKEVGDEMGCSGTRAQQLVSMAIKNLKSLADKENIHFSLS